MATVESYKRWSRTIRGTASQSKPDTSGLATDNLPQPWGFCLCAYLYVREAVVREFDSWAMRAPRAMVELTTNLLGANPLLLGAVELALAPTLCGPTIVPLTGDSVRVYPDRWRP